ncbi:MAG: trypsin-like serine protease [Marivita sp.]|uniref:trypsin-like serine peptidase n=1 Tax=Marivita sp. TaxID=2003365 RepID=UPI0025C60969|nr:trypsin-like serine protease [Marivita sp.]MCI5111507.1 trypsin-like serine protease [Marivita sp.]
MRSLVSLLLMVWTSAAAAQDLPVLPASDHALWQAVGRVNAAGYRTREMCTGTLIAPDKVLTAAHCVAGTDGLGPRADEITFVAGWLRGTAADSVSGQSVWIHPEAYAEGQLDLRFDLAILTLDRVAEVAPLPLITAESHPPYGILGYSVRRPHMLGAAFECDGKIASALLRLDCPVSPGNSGGPVLAKMGDHWAVAGVISAMGQTGALAVPVSRLPPP